MSEQNNQVILEAQNRFKLLFWPTAVYALLFTICLKDAAPGISVLIFALSTLAYLQFVLKLNWQNWQGMSFIYGSGFILLAANCAFTGNETLAMFDYLGMMLLLAVLVLRLNYETSGWDLLKYLSSLVLAGWGMVISLFKPVIDLWTIVHQEKEKSDKPHRYGILIGIAIGLPLLLVILNLLAGADMVFGQLVANIITMPMGFENVISFVLFFLIVGCLTYGGMSYLRSKAIKADNPQRKLADSQIIITIMIMLLVVYLPFSVIQISYLFIRNLTLPAGIIFSEYARSGFFELLAVCMINTLIVIIAISCFKPQKLVNILLTVICGCTYIMIASSALRMLMYISAFDLTLLRVAVLWALVVLVFWIGGLLIKIYRPKFRLFDFGLVTVLVLFILLSYSRPEAMIAKYNLSKDNCDQEYLANLSSDAATVSMTPQALGAYFGQPDTSGNEPATELYIGQIYQRVYVHPSNQDWRAFNISDWQAKQLLIQAVEQYQQAVNDN